MLASLPPSAEVLRLALMPPIKVLAIKWSLLLPILPVRECGTSMGSHFVRRLSYCSNQQPGV